MSLNERQDLFVTHYLANGMNATQAYRDAYNAHDRPDSSVNPSASRLYGIPESDKLLSRKNKAQLAKLIKKRLSVSHF